MNPHLFDGYQLIYDIEDETKAILVLEIIDKWKNRILLEMPVKVTRISTEEIDKRIEKSKKHTKKEE